MIQISPGLWEHIVNYIKRTPSPNLGIEVGMSIIEQLSICYNASNLPPQPLKAKPAQEKK